MSTSNKKYIPKDGVFLSKVDGEGMLYNANNELCYRLNGVATLMWERISEKIDLVEIAKSIAIQFDVTESTVSNDLETLIDDLVKKGLLCESSAS